MKVWLLALGTAMACAQPADLTHAITAASLRGMVSFLAGDALQGRKTPSAGLDVAAAYIESEFRGAGLESPPGGDYSQHAEFFRVTDAGESFQFSLSKPGESPRSCPADRISVASFEAAHVTGAPVYKWAPNVQVDGPLRGRVVILRATSDASAMVRLKAAHPEAIVQLTRRSTGGWRKLLLVPDNRSEGVPLMSVPAEDFEGVFDRLPNGETGARATLNIGAPTVTPVRLRNVEGVVRGSDPRYREQYIVVSAHYDHLGASDAGVYSGANDNASGVAALVSVAAALAQVTPHPKRSLLFVAFFGEENGLLGSRWFTRHPPVPLPQIAAEVNFEQLGRTGDGGTVPGGELGVTGYAFSDLPRMIAPVLRSANVTLRDTSDNIDYFARSDNFPFAEVGIPAHTFVAEYEFPDYHRVTDQWQKLNYENMARLTRALAAAIESLADNVETPHWIESPKTKGYLEAWRAMHR